MNNVLGIVKFDDKHVNIEGLSLYRPIPSIAFCGRFRLMDFVISNMTNSDISNIHVHVNNKQRSVFTHIGSGRQYNINSKRDKITVMHGESDFRTDIYNTDINCCWDNLEHIIHAPEEYVLIASSYFIYVQEFNNLVADHIASDADITMLYKKTNEAKHKFVECNTLILNNNNQVEGIERNYGKYNERNIALDCYVMKKDLFIDLIRQAHKTSSCYWLDKIVSDKLSELNVVGYPLKREVLAINNLDQYFKAHMAMIDYSYAKNYFLNNWPILTRTYDSPPVFYGEKAKVTNSSVSNGSKIMGEIENCFIGRNVIIEEGAVVKNAVLIGDSYIASGANINHAIIDKRVKVQNVKELIGDNKNIIYVNRGNTI
ncbi:MAG: glucose-1-phosphate adenylyltransferase subunit GlgD [Erysipelotrichaceae bacterium]